MLIWRVFAELAIYSLDVLMAINAGVYLGGPVPPFKFFYLYVTATISSMKISFNGVLLLLNLKNCIYNYTVYRCL